MENNDVGQQRVTYLGLMGLFFTLFALFSRRKALDEERSRLKPFDLLLLGLATYRTGRLIAYDKVTEPLRAPFTETKPDQYGAGETVQAKGQGAQKAIGQLIGCPTCIGTWVAAFLVYGLEIAPRPTRVYLSIMSVIGVGELLDTGMELLNWGARASRKDAAPKKDFAL